MCPMAHSFNPYFNTLTMAHVELGKQWTATINFEIVNEQK